MDQAMNFQFRNLFLVTTIVFGLISSSPAQEIEIGQVVSLQETKPGGVPLHHHPPPRLWKHITTGMLATIEEIGKDGRWIAIRLPSGEKAWVNLEYIMHPPLSPSIPTQVPPDSFSKTSGSLTDQEAKVWSLPRTM